jgi:glycosyltransferase involved in cell wall biosynthesis
MTPIKVLHVTDLEKEAHYFNNLVDHTDPNAVEYSVVTFSGDGQFSESMRKRGLKVYALSAGGRKHLPKAARGLSKIIKTDRPDIIHTHLFDPTVVGLIIGNMQGRKTVLTRHHSDALHLIPNRVKRSFYLMLERMNNRKADHIIAPSRMVRDCIVGWEGTPAEKVSVIPYGQTIERFDLITPAVIQATRAAAGMDKQLSLVCVSRLFHMKGHEYLFKSLAAMVRDGLDAKLYLVGSGEHQGALERLAADLGITHNVEFLGFRDDVLQLIGAADIIVHPSLEDALSQSLIESLMLARPIIATDISGAADTLDGGKYGRLVPPADADSFREALKETIDNLDEARRRAKEGRAFLLRYMDAKRVAAEYTEIYRRVLTN